MKRTALFALMISLLLCGCGVTAGDEERLQGFREEVRSGRTEFTADITARNGDKVFRCSVEGTHAAGETAVTLTAPESIRGVSYRAGEESRELSYDGAVLYAGQGPGLTAAEGLPVLLEALREGHLLTVGREKELLTGELETAGGVQAALWLEEGKLLCAQLSENGVTGVQIDFRHWQTEETDSNAGHT